MINKDILLSVIIPCRNEEKYIGKCLDSLLEQKDIDFQYEIIVVDGMSEDKTREIIQGEKEYRNIVRIKDNPNRITPSAMNIGIKNSKGKIVAICGAHAIYDQYFLKNGVELLKANPNIIGAGGPIISVSNSDFGKAVSLAMSSPIGVGNAKHRFPEYEGFAEMACFPFYKKEAFEKIGYFDERFIRNQDDEFSFRLNLAGEKIFISPKVKSEYFVRSSPKKLFKQYFQYGFWRYFVLKKHKKQISVRQIVPSVFLMTLFLTAAFGFFMHSLLLALWTPAVYLIIIFLFSLKIFFKNGLKIGTLYIFAVIILHTSYGLGLIWAILKESYSKNKVLSGKKD
ncbi:MAG: glycosyltransferase family 2 protein [Chlorobi bacterium]|nr:glycosyltransferase family 2 protein [Chlorobiota bacterium]